MSTNVSYEPPPVRVAYGVDVSAEWVTVARVERKGNKWTSEPCVSVGTDGDPVAAMGQVMDRLTSEVALGNALVAGAMPIRQSSVRRLTAPFSSRSKARKVLPALLDIQIPFPLESCRYGFPRLYCTETGTVDALALAVRETDLAHRMQEMQRWRLDPHVLDHEGLALWSIASHVPNRFLLICYLGEDRTSLVYGTGDRLQAALQTQIGTRDLSGDEKALAHWLGWAQRAVRALVDPHPNAVPIWRWTGPRAGGEQGRSLLEAQLTAHHALQFETDANAAYVLASSLAYRALGRDATAWNFRAGPDTHPHVIHWRARAVKRTAAALLIGGLGLGIANGFVQHLADREQQFLDRELTQRTRALSDLPNVPRGQERILAERAMETHRLAYAPFLRAFAPSHLALARDLLRAAAGHGLHYDQVTLRPNALLVQGHAPDWDHGEALAAQLRAAGWTVNVERQDAIDVERVRFRITGEKS